MRVGDGRLHLKFRYNSKQAEFVRLVEENCKVTSNGTKIMNWENQVSSAWVICTRVAVNSRKWTLTNCEASE